MWLLALLACLPEEAPFEPDLVEHPELVDDLPYDEGWTEAFEAGQEKFGRWHLDRDGLGPCFIELACGSCHSEGGRGRANVQKFVVLDEAGAPVPDATPYGNTTRSNVAGGARSGVKPPYGTEGLVISTREAPGVYGRGLMEAIADEDLLALAEAQATGGRVSGRANLVEYTSVTRDDARGFPLHTTGDLVVGRFGLKARVATLDDFAADASQGDMSLTSPLRPDELPNPEGRTDDRKRGLDLTIEDVDHLADYTRLLRIPLRAEVDGADLFEQVGCAECHVPRLRTRADWPIAAIADVDAPVYTDLLLHDLGPDHDDGLGDGDATGSEWRTAPLIALAKQPNFLHDGRAETVEDAIRLHGGPGSEAAASVDAWLALDPEDRDQLVKFVTSR